RRRARWQGRGPSAQGPAYDEGRRVVHARDCYGAIYCASKAGLIGLTKTLARELGPKGITVNAVAPGMVMTEMARALPPEFVYKARAEAVLPELATPEDVANTVLFLLSDAARMITGEVIRVDAGQYV
ncbi:MAG TPA: SDR family oxidoreductase, partial [Candidatus Binatia bacterium]|nr:SDR family oxidoreductase [Candidatus Binatia bacterium]